MSSRFASHRVRFRYLNALKTSPIVVGLAEPPSVDDLSVLGTAEVDGRALRLGTMRTGAVPIPRLWIAFETIEPALLGYVTGLVTGEPDLWVCEPAHRQWTFAGANAAKLTRAATGVWFASLNECEG